MAGSGSGSVQDGTEPMSSALFSAAVLGNLENIRQNESCLLTRFTRTGNSVLHIASEFGQLLCVQEILQLGKAELLQKANHNGETALHIAAKRGQLSIVEQIVQFAGSCLSPPGHQFVTVTNLLRMRNKKGSTALHEAARYGYDGVVKYLALKDSDFRYGTNLAGETPLYLAAERGHHKSAEAILLICKSPTYQGPQGRTALHAAVIANSRALTAAVLKKIPSLAREMDGEHWTPLHWAAFYDHSLRVMQLLSHEESVAYIPDENGLIPLHVAASRGHIRSMEVLISKCPDCYDILDSKGRNVIHHAALSKQLGTLRELRKTTLFEKLMNEGDIDGNTPLHLFPGSHLPSDFLLGCMDRFAVNAKGLTFEEALARRPLNEQIQKDGGRFRIGKNKKLINLRACKPRVAVGTPSHDSSTNYYQERSSGDVYGNMKVEIEIRLIVAALISTVTFAAGFTFPGGYWENTGTAKLSTAFGFRCFIVSDTVAVLMSFSAILLYFRSLVYIYSSNQDLAQRLIFCGNILSHLAIYFTVISFIAAVSTTSGSAAISTTIVVSGGAFFTIYALMYYLVVIYPRSYRGSKLRGLSLLTPSSCCGSRFRVTLRS